jgi:hypothetical protein
MRKVFIMAVPFALSAVGCASTGGTFNQARKAAGGSAVVLSGDGGSRVLVAPALQGRILTTEVGAVDSVAFVSLPEIHEGEVHTAFNNFGGQDRFWIGPEAGQFGIYFPPGAELDRKIWRVPPDLNAGGFPVVGKTDSTVRFSRDMTVTNYRGTPYKVRVDREVGLIPSGRLPDEIGVTVPAGVHYAGSYSQNSLINAGLEAWKKDTGLINIWVLGQFAPGDRTVIIAPTRPGSGPAYRDEMYFGKVPADRLKVVGNAVVFRADAKKEGKFGVSQERTTGRAGSFDFAKDLLVVVKYDVPREKALYGNSAWVKNQPDPYSGDLFQTYNSDGPGGKPPGRYAFYELESVSPSVELKPGEAVRHRHATYCFQGEYGQLRDLARAALGVDLDEVKRAMF